MNEPNAEERIVRYEPVLITDGTWNMPRMSPHPGGPYVRYEDHMAEVAKLQDALALYVDSYKRVESECDALARRVWKAERFLREVHDWEYLHTYQGPLADEIGAFLAGEGEK